jgi:hypothetical protein
VRHVSRALRDMGWTVHPVAGDRLVYRRPPTRHLTADAWLGTGPLADLARFFRRAVGPGLDRAFYAGAGCALGFFVGQLVRCFL